jgi:molybdopterin/thiamine biosynthesis adenylyltransferase/rhodanese-related sulfurtransferase
MTPQEQIRYQRHTSLTEIGTAGQLKFKQARVLVIGAGGLGCPVLQYLTAAGIGHIGIVDSDVVEESNLQRQILYATSDIGKSKAECSKQKLQEQNPFSHIESYPIRLDAGNAVALISDYDLVVDGSDNFQTRYLVNDACVIANKPFVFGSIYKFEGQVSVFNYQEGPTYRCLYPEPNDLGSCAEVGVLGVLPGTIGCLMATEALKIISGAGHVLSGKLIVYDALKANFSSFSFQANEDNKQMTAILPFDDSCLVPVQEITALELKSRISKGEVIAIIDVREEHEYAEENIAGKSIPLKTLLHNMHLIPKNIPVVIHCKSGARSRQAVEILMGKGYTNTYSLMGGIDAMNVSRLPSNADKQP